MAKIEIVAERCKACGYCVKFCPNQVLDFGREVNQKGYEYVEPIHMDQCVGCCMCAIMCPDGAINVYK